MTALAALLLGWPQLLGAQRLIGVAQAISFRGPILLGALGLAALLLVATGLLRASRRHLALPLAVLLVFAAGTGAVLADRGFDAGAAPEGSAPEDIRVLSWNTRGNEPGSPTIAQLAIALRADVVALPETTEELGVEIANLMAEAGMPMWVHTRTFDEEYRATATTLLISPRLGDYEVDEGVGDTAVLPTVVARSLAGGPTIVAAHAVSPAPEPARMAQWRQDLAWLAERCDENTIMAGDFNATIDHMAGLERGRSEDFHSVLGACADAAVQRGGGALGTWTAGLSPYLGTQIDHILSTSERRATAFELVQSENRSGSDHRPVFAVLSPAG